MMLRFASTRHGWELVRVAQKRWTRSLIFHRQILVASSWKVVYFVGVQLNLHVRPPIQNTKTHPVKSYSWNPSCKRPRPLIGTDCLTILHCERFEPRSHFKSRLSLIVRVNVVLNRTVVVDSDWRFDNLCGSHLQSQSELYHVSRWYYILWLLIWLVNKVKMLLVVCQWSRDVIGYEDS